MGALASALMGACADPLWRLKHEHQHLEVTLFTGLSRDFAYRVDHGELRINGPEVYLLATLSADPISTI
jgi:hypothetical protein